MEVASSVGDKTCLICQADLFDETPRLSLSCGHCFHKECLDELQRVKELALSDVKCPVCKRNANDCLQLEQAMGDGFKAPGSAARTQATITIDESPSAAASASAPSEPVGADAGAEAKAEPAPKKPLSTAEVGAVQGLHLHALVKQDTVTCGTCGLDVEMLKCRVMSKSKMTWKCKKCDTKTTMLYRHFGRGANSLLTEIPEDERKKFFAETSDKNQSATVQKAHDLLDKYESKESGYEQGGEYLPISVWVNRGFDGAAIESKSLAKDIRECRLFGLVYRVPILKTFERGMTGLKATSTLQANGKRQKTAASSSAAKGDADAADADADPINPPTDESSDESGSSSSSSSSKKKSKKAKKKGTKKKKRSSKKEKKRLQKEKKRQKEAEKLAKKDAAEKEKESKLKIKTATNIAMKLGGPLSSFQKHLDNPAIAMVPSAVKDQAKSTFEKLKTIEQQAALVVAGSSTDLPAATAEDIS